MSHAEITLAAKQSNKLTAQSATTKFVKATNLVAGMLVKCCTHDEDGDRKVNLPIQSVKPTNHVKPCCKAGELLEVFIKGWDCNPFYISKHIWIETVKPAKPAKPEKLAIRLRINNFAEVRVAKPKLLQFNAKQIDFNIFEYECKEEWTSINAREWWYNERQDFIIRILGLINITDITFID